MKNKIKTTALYVFLGISVFLINLPILNMIGVAFKSNSEIMTNNGLFPKQPTLTNFIEVFKKSNYFLYLRNSIIVALTVTLLTMLVASMAGYAMSRYIRKYKVLKTYSKMLLIMQMFPTVLMLIPLFIIFKNIGLGDSMMSVIILYMTFSLPFCTWMMQGFFDGVPIELDEAGKVDGCSPFQIFFRLILPVSGPALASTGIYTFIYCWNEYLLASVFLKKEAVKTLPVGIQVFMQQFSTDWGLLMAASVIAIIPVSLFLIFLQKYLVAGLTAGAVKG